MEGIVLAIWALFGVAGYKMAEDRNREPTVGAVAGLLFGVFAILYYLMAGKKAK